MKITDELIDELAQLAKLEFNPEERDEIKTDLERMIVFIDKLNEIDTEGVGPLLHISDAVNVLREDEVTGSVSRSEALLNAPQKNEEFFLVPKVIKKQK